MEAKEYYIDKYYLINNDICKMDSHILLDAINGVVEGSIEPIPLTGEWLVKFGFKIISYESCEDYYSTTDKVAMNYDDFFVIIIDSCATRYDDYEYTASKVGYVHQLQNLYFALTGEELTTSL